MTTLGYVTKTGENAYKGTLQLLNFRSPIELKPLRDEDRITTKAPEMEIIAKGLKIGSARNRTSQAGKPYVALAITHAQLKTGTMPIFGNLGPANDQDDPDVLAIIAS
jgi:uncharacterized protein (DUF736 family)